MDEISIQKFKNQNFQGSIAVQNYGTLIGYTSDYGYENSDAFFIAVCSTLQTLDSVQGVNQRIFARNVFCLKLHYTDYLT